MTEANKKKIQSKMVKWLIMAIDTFQSYNTGLSDETLGWKSIGDSSVVGRLRSGGDVTTKKYEDLRDFLVSPPQGFLPLKTKEN